MGRLSLRGAARLGRWEKAISERAPAARGCSVEGEREVFLAEFPLRWAARTIEGGRRLFSGGLPLRGAA